MKYPKYPQTLTYHCFPSFYCLSLIGFPPKIWNWEHGAIRKFTVVLAWKSKELLKTWGNIEKWIWFQSECICLYEVYLYKLYLKRQRNGIVWVGPPEERLDEAYSESSRSDLYLKYLTKRKKKQTLWMRVGWEINGYHDENYLSWYFSV